MSKVLAAVTVCLGLLALAPALVRAQPSTEADRVVRQGDTIEWTAVSGNDHRVRFGGTIQVPGKGAVALTSAVKVRDRLLENFRTSAAGQDAFVVAGDIGQSPQLGSGMLLTATVRNDAPVGDTLIFTCGVHTTGMVSEPFTIAAKDPNQPSRTLKITGESPMKWMLEVPPPPGRKVQVDNTP